MGADDAIHVEVPDKALANPLEPLGVSKILHEIVKKAAEEEEVGLIIMGKQAIDDDASQTGQMLAGLLNWPQATYASKLEFLSGKPEKGAEAQVTREIDGGLGIVKTKLPFVMTTDLRLNGKCRARFSSANQERDTDEALRSVDTNYRAPIRIFAQHHEGQEEAFQEVHAEGSRT